MYAASAYADDYDAGACVRWRGRKVEDNLSRAPSLVVATQTVQIQVCAHAQNPKATDVTTHCLTAAEGPHHVPDRVLTSGVYLS